MKKVPETKYCYATEDGRIWSSYWERYLTPYINHAGYLCVQVAINSGEVKGFRVNRMVAMAFLENPNNFPEVNHKNKIKTDNHVENLEWCTSSYNVEHGKGVKIRLVDPEGVIHESPSIRRICRENNLNYGNIHAVISGKVFHAEGWRNADLYSGKFEGKLKRKTHVFLRSPAGEICRVSNVRKFARENTLHFSCLNRLLANKGKSHKGWRVA